MASTLFVAIFEGEHNIKKNKNLHSSCRLKMYVSFAKTITWTDITEWDDVK